MTKDLEIKKLLEFIIFNQAYLNKRIDNIEKKLSNSIRSAPMSSYLDELKKEFDRNRDVVSEIVNAI